MKVIQALPPNFEQIKAAIKIDDWDKWIKEKGTVFTYGDTIYNPSDAKFPVHLLVHEGTHEKQQGSNPKEWWDKYLVDLEFRFEQELEAYSAQYKFICECNGPSFPAKVKKAILNQDFLKLLFNKQIMQLVNLLKRSMRKLRV